jgi:hypothetical protein
MKMPAGNERFGVMAAVAPQKRKCKFETLYPATTVVEAATTPSRHHVGCKCVRARRQNRKTWNERAVDKADSFI